MEQDLYVEERTGLVRKVRFLGNVPISDEPYKPNGKCIFVNPKTNFLEEGEFLNDPFEKFLHNSNYKKTSDFKSNGNAVLFHPTKKEFAEVKPGYGWGCYDKVRDLPITAVI